MSNQNVQAQIEGLATLLVLDDEIKKVTNLREFGFFATNETHRLIPYHTSYLWQFKEFQGAVVLAQSGTAELDKHAPINQWLKNTIEQLAVAPQAKELHQFSLSELEGAGAIDLTKVVLTEPWQETLPANVLWCPLMGKSKDLTGGLLFMRDEPFTESEIKMIRWLISSFQYTWLILTKPKLISSWRKIKERHWLIGISIAVLLVLLFPIRLSVLGTATVVPRDPTLVNAPMEGVIKSFAVHPGETVKKGQLLLTMDKTDLQNNASVNEKEFLLTQAKLRTAINQGYSSQEHQAEIPVLQAELAINKARVDYTQELLAKADLKANAPGIVVFDSREDWIGQPVKTGERILVVANPDKVKLKIMLPISNIIKLKVGADGDFFLYGQLTSIPIKLDTLGYNAKLMPNKILAYELSATFVHSDDKPQLGAEGTARLYGTRVPLIYYFLRRPLEAIRQGLGI